MRAKLLVLLRLLLMCDSWERFCQYITLFLCLMSTPCRKPNSPTCAQVCVPWQMFGSSGYQRQPLCVVQSFVRRSARQHAMTKCAVKASHLRNLVIHRHHAHGACICPDGSLEPLQARLLYRQLFALRPEPLSTVAKNRPGDDFE